MCKSVPCMVSPAMCECNAQPIWSALGKSVVWKHHLDQLPGEFTFVKGSLGCCHCHSQKGGSILGDWGLLSSFCSKTGPDSRVFMQETFAHYRLHSEGPRGVRGHGPCGIASNAQHILILYVKGCLHGVLAVHLWEYEAELDIDNDDSKEVSNNCLPSILFCAALHCSLKTQL